MSPRVESLRWMPPRSWWAMLTCVIAASLAGNWFIGAGMLVVLLVHAFRPFDFVAAFLVVIAGSTLVNYAGGNMALQLTRFTGAVLLMLICYPLSTPGRAFVLPWSNLSRAILAYVALSMANFCRGLLSAYPLKSVFFEVLPVLAIGTALLVGNGFVPRRDLRLAVLSLIGIALASATLGFFVFAVIHTHTSGIYFNEVPGIVGLFLIGLALRSRRLSTSFLWIVISLPLFLHQFLSYRRSLWISCLAGLLTTVGIFAVKRPRSAWARSGIVIGLLVAMGLAGAFGLTVFYGQTDILRESVSRFASIGGTELTMETRANVLRLVEFASAMDHIQRSPLIGHGLGFTWSVRNSITGEAQPPQWWADQNYTLIWLKQGLVGLGLYLWIIWAAFRLGAGHARRCKDVWESSWFAGAATAAVFLAVMSLTDFPFDQVNPTFLLAFLFGGSMALARQGTLAFGWRPREGRWTGAGARVTRFVGDVDA